MIRIYLVDDETWVIIGLKKLIEKSGMPFTVIGEADNGITAWEDIKRLKPDILLANIRMPGMSGLELLNALASDEAVSTRAVLISGYAEFEYAQKALRLGAYDYLLKPVKPQDLYNVLKKLSDEILQEERQQTPPVPDGPPVSPTVMQKILNEMQTGFTRDLSLTSLSERYGISSGHLSLLIKQELGLSFTEYMTSRRIQKAKELLADESRSIEEVANAAGYHDYFYFTKIFKKITGISPSKYRKELRTNKISSTVTNTKNNVPPP